jgi:hypothetical protein
MAESIRLYLDEDAQRTALVRALRARNIDVMTVNEAGRAGLLDEEQLEFAAATRRTVFSYNRGDYNQLHNLYLQSGRSHSGIIVSDQAEIGVVIRRLLKLLDARSAEDMTNRLEFLRNWR